MYKGFLKLIIFCFIVSVFTKGAPAQSAGENIVFICASTSTPAGIPIPTSTKKPGFFARLFGFGPKEPTYIVIECSQGKLPEPVTPPPTTTIKKETGLTGAIRKVLSPKSSTDSKTTTKKATISKAPTKEEQLKQIERDILKTKVAVDSLNKQVAIYKEQEKRSLYWGKVSVTLKTSRYRRPNEELLIISVSRNAPKDTRIPLSTFRIADGHGEVFSITGGTKLPIPGLANEKKDIVLEPGQSAIISTGSSPNGLSFMVNSCTGYFNRGSRFNPAIPTACPKIINEPWVSKLPPQCWDYIKTIRSCQIPYPLPLSLKPECQEAIAEKVNYNSCVNDHKSDKNFYKNEWRLFLNRTTPIFDLRYDSISILDAEGKLVWYKVWY